MPGTPEAGRIGGPLSSSGHAGPRTQSLSSQWEGKRNTLMRRRRLRGTPLEDDQEQETTWPARPAGPGHLVLEQPAWLVLAQRREVGPPPGLAAAGRGLSPGP